MVTYPVRTRREGYRGSNAQKRQRTAEYNRRSAEIETRINDLLRQQVDLIASYTYHEIAHAIGYTVDQILDVCYSINAGSGGLTVIRPGLTHEDALREHAKQFVQTESPEDSRSGGAADSSTT